MVHLVLADRGARPKGRAGIPRAVRAAGPVVASVALALVSLAAAAPAARADAAYTSCVQSMWPEARRAGVSRATFDAAFDGMTPDPKTLRLMNRQSEFVKPIWEYLETAVSDARIENGRKMLARHGDTLRRIEERFGVDAEVVVAVWGMETNYGGFMGQHNAIRALSTLACKASRRRPFWRNELVTALEILQEGHVSLNDMESSWAGAMGHTQFMPSSWEAYAADYDGDGKRNVWRDVPDALASTANYLRAFGWRYGETWGYEVALPEGFDYRLAGGSAKRTLAQWRRLGVRRVGGLAFPRPGDEAYLLLPAGARGPAFLMLPNFDVIKRYNNATSYALGVGHLTDRIIGRGDFAQAWPKNERPLSRSEVKEMQSLLTRAGFSTGGVDGLIGPNTREAIRSYQRANGKTPDGFASAALLDALKRR